ncbi:MAG TPA: ABC transporter ATP-binding protein [Acidimicrobiales bacterium]|nr:ABC transporter ATP-binding protein [Acidimicrobiales bacterium]
MSSDLVDLSAAPLIQAAGLSKSFGGIHAVQNCSLEAYPGRITGLIGPNGAGKSTLLALLAGALRPDSGKVLFDGHDVTRMHDWQRARLGLVRTFQVSRPLGHMTVLENMLIGAMDMSGETYVKALLNRKQWKENEERDLIRAVELLERFNLLPLTNDYAEILSGGQMRLLELARALMAKPKLLLLDEPFAGVNPTLAQELADHVEQLNREGQSMILIEHELNLVGRLCDPVIVMTNGSVLASGSIDELGKNAEVVDAYLGRTERVDASPLAATSAPEMEAPHGNA